MLNLGVLEQLLNHLNRHALCKTTDKILLAASGGLDSMVMFHLLRDAGFTLGVAHCNFQLRGEQSDADETFVQDTCKLFNIPFYLKRFDTAAYATGQGISMQMAARELRYQFFQETLADHGYRYVATAHHFNDNIESILLNLVRGTGFDGMRGIAPKKGNIIRPLLFATRGMVLDYAEELKILWREDVSNLSDDYQRNFIRHQVVPRLLELNPGFEESFRDTHERLLGGSQFAQAYIKAFQSSAVEVSNQVTTIDIQKIRRSESPAVLLWELIKEFGFKYGQCRHIVMEHQPGKLFYAGSYQLLVDRTHYILERIQVPVFNTLTIEEGQATAGEDPFTLSIQEVLKDDFELVRDSGLAQLDADKVQFPLVWRTWQAGDYFVPLGMRQEKKLSDFLIDLKIPFNSKADITVLESRGEIIWVVGYRISERYKVTADTKRVLIIEQKQNQG